METDPFRQLENSWVLTVGGDPVPSAGSCGLGASALVFLTRDQGLRTAAEQREANETLGLGDDIGVERVGDPWQFMRRAAACGIAAIEYPKPCNEPPRFLFMVRVQDAGSALPNVLTAQDGSRWLTSRTVRSTATIPHADLLHWKRFDILDGPCARWGEYHPFRDWMSGDRFWGLGDDEQFVLVAEVPLLGPWNAIDGAIPFFTSRELAESFLAGHLADGANRIVMRGPDRDPTPRPVECLRHRLRDVYQFLPGAAWCVNPRSNRENAGYGRLDTMFEADVDSANWPFRTVGGEWLLGVNNGITRVGPIESWSGRDTIRWSGGASITMLHARHGSVPDESLRSLGATGYLESDAREVLAHALEGIDLVTSYERMMSLEESGTDGLTLFHVLQWDTVTGDQGAWRFANFIEALQHLAAYERDHDAAHRSQGALGHGAIGFPASGRQLAEDLRSQRFQQGIRHIAARLSQRRYRPSDVDDVVALCNATLRTLHVEYAGFGRDLLLYAQEEERERILEDLGIDPDAWDKWQASDEFHVDPHGKTLVLARMAEDDWNALDPRSRMFLATSLLQLEEQGHAPQRDYAPINLGMVKAMEVEMARALYGAMQGVDRPSRRKGDRDLARFLDGGKALTFHPLVMLFRPPRAQDSALVDAVKRAVRRLGNAEFLTSDVFFDAAERVRTEFRNGGVHDRPIVEATCRECLDVLVGTREHPGIVARLVRWRPAGGQRPLPHATATETLDDHDGEGP